MLHRLLTLLGAAAFSILALATPAPAAVPDVWAQWQGVPETWIRSLDYVTPAQIVAGGENDGVFTSTNAIGPWSDVSSTLTGTQKQVRQAVGANGQVYLATSAGLFVGDGLGGGWTQLGVAESTPPSKRLNMGGVQSIVFNSPTDMVVAIAGAAGPGVYWSADSGVTWTRASGLTDATYYLTGGQFSPVLYAAADSGFYASLDKGRSWVMTSDGVPPSETPLRIAVSPDNPQHLYGATSGGVFRSNTGGVTWFDATGSGPTALNGGTVRAFQLTPAAFWAGNVPRFFAGSEQGVWATNDGGSNWGRMSATKFPAGGIDMQHEPVWALNVGFGAPGSLMAGTQGHGVFALPLQGVAAPSSAIPSPTGTLKQNSVLTAGTGAWGGTSPFWFLFQWKRCTQSSAQDAPGATCTNVANATGETYALDAGDVGKYMRVGVRATNVVQPGYSGEVLSNSAGITVAGPPPNPPQPPSVSYPLLVGGASAPWGATMSINTGGNWHQGANPPAATTFRYLWYRCTGAGGTGCTLIDDADEQSYTTTIEDVQKYIKASVIATIGTDSSDERLAGVSGVVYERKPVNVELPRVVGPAYIGTVLQSNVGAWEAHDPTYTRRWLRCNSDGVQCNPTSPVVTTPTYAVTEADRGSALKVEVTATVVDVQQNRVTTIESAQSAIVTDAPPPPVDDPPPGGSDPPPPPGGDPTPLVIRLKVPSRLRVGAKLAGPRSVPGCTNIRYRWLRNGKKISKATKRVYRITRKDRGKRIALRVRVNCGGTVRVARSRAVRIPRR